MNYAMDSAVHSDQTGRICDQIFTNAITFLNTCTVCDLKILHLVTHQAIFTRRYQNYNSQQPNLSKLKNREINKDSAKGTQLFLPVPTRALKLFQDFQNIT